MTILEVLTLRVELAIRVNFHHSIRCHRTNLMDLTSIN